MTFDRWPGDVEDPGGVGGGEFEDVAEDEGASLVAGQALRRRLTAVEPDLRSEQGRFGAAIVRPG
ncbi:hypothetical protein ABZ942_37360 [Nocardia sp. NPDC046473]|uniref:hypothetical protein n=1 Tax=Nocardia sp. NPDC046473 TaxID=3155733 RepID=UPI0033FD67A6